MKASNTLQQIKHDLFNNWHQLSCTCPVIDHECHNIVKGIKIYRSTPLKSITELECLHYHIPPDPQSFFTTYNNLDIHDKTNQKFPKTWLRATF